MILRMHSAIRSKAGLRRHWPIARVRVVRLLRHCRRAHWNRAPRKACRRTMRHCAGRPCSRIAGIDRLDMRATGKWPSVAALCLIAGCTGIPAAEDLPAVIVAPDAQSRAELQHAVSAALDRTSVILADDALTRDSLLTMEHARLPDARAGIAQGRAQGREMRMPEQFRLVKSGQLCVLIHERSGRRIALTGAKCAAQH